MNVLKRTWWLFIISFISLIVFPFLPVPSAYAADEKRTVKVGVYDNKPKVYRDQNGAISGLFPDILNYIAGKENWRIEYVYGTWEEGLSRLENGQIHIMVDVAYSTERQEKYDFADESVLSSWGILFVQKNSSIDSFAKLDGKRIAILKSSVYFGGPEGVDQYLKAFGLTAEFVTVDEYAEVFALLNKGKVDAAVVSRIFALTNQKDYPNVKPTDIFFSPTELRFALTKNYAGNPYLIDRLDYWTKKLKGGYEGVYTLFLEQNGLSGMSVNKEIIPEWVRYAALVIAAMLLLSWLTILALRRARTIITRQLQEKELLLGELLRQTPIIVFSLNTDGIITLAEGKLMENKELTRGFSVGKSIFDQYTNNPLMIDQIKKALHGKETDIKNEMLGNIWRMHMFPVIKSGAVMSVVGVAVDMTDEIKLDHAKMEFLSLASHHLRTLPTGIKWTMELLTPRIEKALRVSDIKLWNDLKETSSRLIELADIISKAAQLELGKMVVFSEKIDVAKLIDKEIDEVQIIVQKKHLRIAKQYKLRDIVSDKNQMQMIIHTLLSNAVRYISDGGSIEIHTLSSDDHFMLTVKDTGWGIPKDQQNKVFTRLFRADNVVKQDVDGLGLGLFITKLLVEKLGGKIWFESEIGKGSTFFVKLPKRVSNVLV